MLRMLVALVLGAALLSGGSPVPADLVRSDPVRSDPVLADPVLGDSVPADSARGGTWTWPVDPPRVVERPFVAPATRYSAGHRGVDLRSASTVYAPADGTVRFAGVVVDRPVLSIDHGGGVMSSYEPVVASVAKGDSVVAGQAIGTVLDGHCRSPCVHLGVRVDGEYVSPLSFFGEIPRAVLLPTRG